MGDDSVNEIQDPKEEDKLPTLDSLKHYLETKEAVDIILEETDMSDKSEGPVSTYPTFTAITPCTLERQNQSLRYPMNQHRLLRQKLRNIKKIRKNLRMKEAIQAKHMNVENALERKNLRMKEAIWAKHMDFENALERKNLRMKEAIEAKNMNFENALRFKRQMIERSLPLKYQGSSVAGRMLGKITLIFAQAVFAHPYMDKEFNMVEDLWDFIHVIAPMLKKNPQEIRENVMTKSYKHGRLMAVHAIGFKESDLRIRVNDGCVFVKGEANTLHGKKVITEPVAIRHDYSYDSHSVIAQLIGGEVLVFVPRSAKRENQECVHVGWGDVMG
ncbi:hypothetical protein Tco_1174495 [Tanacetum coccineum]